MTDNNYQPDFFGEQYGDKNSGKPGFLDRYAKRGMVPYVRIPIEYTVIIGIVVLVLFVLAYAIGVERGKRIAQDRFSYNSENAPSLETKQEWVDSKVKITDIEETKKGNIKEITTISEEIDKVPEELESEKLEVPTIKIPDSEKVKAPAKTQKVPETPGNYVIQLASTKNADAAKKEVSKLKAKGKNAYYLQSGEWYQICVRGFKTMEEARKEKNILDKDFPDCYVKKQK